MQAELTGLLGPFRHLSVVPALEVPTSSLTDSQSPAVHASIDHPRSNTAPWNGLQIQTFRAVNVCQHYCPCICHTRKQISIPRTMKRLFGRDFVRIGGLGSSDSRCNNQSCKGRTARHLKIRYFLPTWLAMRMITISFTSSPSHGPEMLVRFPRLAPVNNGFVVVICGGDLDSLKSSMATGECTPYDMLESGATLLQVCVAF